MAGYIGTQAVSVNTTSATISDDLVVGDDATITGDLDVDGTSNLDVVDIDGAVDMASTLQVDGAITSNGLLTVDGSANSSQAIFTGTSGRGLEISTFSVGAADEGVKLDATASGTTGKIILATNGNNKFTMDGTGDIILAGTSNADEANKSFNLQMLSHDTNEENVNILQVENEGAFNQISIGGGTSALNCATAIRFMTGSVDTTSGTERMSIIAGGNVGINISAPLDLLHLNDPNDDCVLNLDTAQANKNSMIKFSDPDAQGRGFIQYAHSDDSFRVITAGAEKFRIGSNGLTDLFSSTTAFRIRTGGTGTNTQILSGANGASNVGDGTEAIVIFANGNIQNENNSYGALSDEKIKENIADATDKLEDIKKVKVRNFNIIGDSTKQIGVVAQELETIFPALVEAIKDPVDEDAVDEDGNQIETETKSVKYSIFVPILIKAMQEQQTLIEALTNRITALEG